MQQACVTTVILTFNEEIHIERAIACAKAYSPEVLVVDSYSTDRTVELALAAGARVLQNPFVSHARQFNWALDNGDITTPWTLRLDADEIIGPDLAAKISGELPSLENDVSGILFNRRHIFMGKWVRHGGRYPLYMLRLWRTGLGRAEDRWMDEHIVVQEGRTIIWEGEFSDACERDLSFFIRKHDSYATREAIEILDKKYNLLGRASETGYSSHQARTKRFIKEHLYNHLPLGTGPMLYFLYRTLIQRGILDGKTGMIYHVMQGFWYRMLVFSKTIEFDRAISGEKNKLDKINKLSIISDIDLK